MMMGPGSYKFEAVQAARPYRLHIETPKRSRSHARNPGGEPQIGGYSESKRNCERKTSFKKNSAGSGG
jgi:hypothetical protein